MEITGLRVRTSPGLQEILVETKDGWRLAMVNASDDPFPQTFIMTESSLQAAPPDPRPEGRPRQRTPASVILRIMGQYPQFREALQSTLISALFRGPELCALDWEALMEVMQDLDEDGQLTDDQRMGVADIIRNYKRGPWPA